MFWDPVIIRVNDPIGIVCYIGVLPEFFLCVSYLLKHEATHHDVFVYEACPDGCLFFWINLAFIAFVLFIECGDFSMAFLVGNLNVR